MGKPSHEYIYGLNPCFEVIRGGKRRLHSAYLGTGSQENPRIKKLAALCQTKGISIEWVERDRLFQLCQSREHQGAVIRSSLYPYSDFEPMLDCEKLLLLDNVEDPQNVGAILRSAEIFGFKHVALPNKGVPEVYPSIVKVSAGATEHLQIAREGSANSYIRKALDWGFKIVALDEEGKTGIKDVAALKLDKMLLVIGGEGKSVGQFIINNAHYVTKIEQKGRINSLNASVAAGIAMFALGE